MEGKSGKGKMKENLVTFKLSSCDIMVPSRNHLSGAYANRTPEDGNGLNGFWIT